MTLTPHTPDTLDALALRLLDAAGLIRRMATLSRENAVESFQLHGNKVQEWMNHLEGWAYDGAARLDAQIMRERGARRSQATAAPVEKPVTQRPAKRPRKTSNKYTKY
jgi:hypothetical protein